MTNENKVVELPPPPRVIYVFHVEVLSVRELKEQYDIHRPEGSPDPNPDAPVSGKDVEYKERTIGWAIRMTDSSAIIWPEDPGYKPGDIITWKITKEPHLNTAEAKLAHSKAEKPR